MNFTKAWAAAAAMVALTGAAQATLVSLGDGTVKDTNTNLIWLQDWNMNGRNDWGQHTPWAANLTFAGSSDWALPTLSDFTTLFAEYGSPLSVAEFINVQYDFYWTSTESINLYATTFNPIFGDGSLEAKFFFNASAVAVRAATVPEPQTLALLLLALGATVVERRRRAR